MFRRVGLYSMVVLTKRAILQKAGGHRTAEKCQLQRRERLQIEIWNGENIEMLWCCGTPRCSQGYQSLVMIIITLDAELLCNRYCISIAINDKVAMRLWDKKISFGYCQLQMVNACGVFGEALEYCFMISQVERREKEHLEGLINFKFNLTYPQYYGILTIVQNSDEIWSD